MYTFSTDGKLVSLANCYVWIHIRRVETHLKQAVRNLEDLC